MLPELVKRVDLDATKVACVDVGSKDGLVRIEWGLDIPTPPIPTYSQALDMYPSGHGEAFCPDGSRFMANVSWEEYEDAMSLYVGSHWRDEVPCVSQLNE
jgi:hypothetical protein